MPARSARAILSAHASQVAPLLLGSVIRAGGVAVRLTEVEAYGGVDEDDIRAAKTVDGAELERGSGTDQPLDLGAGRMIEGFEAGLIGATAGETRTLGRFYAGREGQEVPRLGRGDIS